MSISHRFSKIKVYWGSREGERLFMITVIILSSTLSFGLGRLSKIEELKEPIRLIEPSSQVSAAVSSDGLVVASKSGSKYHYPWCSGAQRIKEENKIWWSSIEEARQAGYEPASNCKGLK